MIKVCIKCVSTPRGRLPPLRSEIPTTHHNIPGLAYVTNSGRLCSLVNKVRRSFAHALRKYPHCLPSSRLFLMATSIGVEMCVRAHTRARSFVAWYLCAFSVGCTCVHHRAIISYREAGTERVIIRVSRAQEENKKNERTKERKVCR